MVQKIIFILFLGIFSSIKAQSLSEIINSEDVLLVDVRSKKEFSSGSVSGAINIPLNDLETQLSDFQGKKNIVIFCRSGKRSKKAIDFLKEKGIVAHNGINTEKIQQLQKINLLQKITFRADKQTTYFIKDGKNIKQIAIALGKNALMKKHTTSVPATLLMIKGKVRFLISDEEIILNELDTYQIPADVPHEVIGVNDENIFVVTKGN